MTQTSPNYRCYDCKRKHEADERLWEKRQAAMACNYFAEKPRHKYLPSENNKGNPEVHYKKCVGNYYDGYWAKMINYYQKYEMGIMPFSGSYFEQPAKFVEAMELVHNLISEHQIKLEKRNRK